MIDKGFGSSGSANPGQGNGFRQATGLAQAGLTFETFSAIRVPSALKAATTGGNALTALAFVTIYAV